MMAAHPNQELLKLVCMILYTQLVSLLCLKQVAACLRQSMRLQMDKQSLTCLSLHSCCMSNNMHVATHMQAALAWTCIQPLITRLYSSDAATPLLT